MEDSQTKETKSEIAARVNKRMDREFAISFGQKWAEHYFRLLFVDFPNLRGSKLTKENFPTYARETCESSCWTHPTFDPKRPVADKLTKLAGRAAFLTARKLVSILK